MRTWVRGHEVEGTVEEISRLLLLVDASPASRLERGRGEASKASPFVSEDLAIAVLTRRPLGETHAKMLNLLDLAGEDWTPAPGIQQELGLSTREFAGVLGAFGKRLSNTDGVGSRSFFDQYWDGENGYNLYRLPSAVRAALRKTKLVP